MPAAAWLAVAGGSVALPSSPARAMPQVIVGAANQLVPATPLGGTAIAWDGDRYLAAWASSKSVMGAFITPAGVMNTPITLMTYPNANYLYDPAVAWDGWEFLVTATEFASSMSIVGVAVNALGSPEAPAVVISPAGAIATGQSQHSSVAGSSATRSFYVAWREMHGTTSQLGPQISGAHVTVDGGTVQVASQAVLSVTGGCTECSGATCYSFDPCSGIPTVASDGNGFLVAWDAPNPVPPPPSLNSQGIFATAVSPDGVPSTPGGLLLSTTAKAAGASATSDGSEYLVAWQESSPAQAFDGRVLATRVSTAGLPLDSPSVIIQPDPVAVGGLEATTWDGRSFIVAWENANQNGNYLSAARVSPGGTVLDPGGFPVASPAAYPKLAAAPAKLQSMVTYLSTGAADYATVSEMGPGGTASAAPLRLEGVQVAGTRLPDGAQLCRASATSAASVTVEPPGLCNVVAGPLGVNSASTTVEGWRTSADSRLASLSLLRGLGPGGVDILDAAGLEGRAVAVCQGGGTAASSWAASLTVAGQTVTTRPLGSQIVLNPLGGRPGSPGYTRIYGNPIVITTGRQRVPAAIVSLNYRRYDVANRSMVASPIEVEFPPHGPLSSLIAGRVLLSYAQAGCG